jgi:hypothetical protein
MSEAAIAQLRAELEAIEADLRTHMASWEYAFAMGSSRDGSSEHPTHWATRARTDDLRRRRAELRARLSELTA